MATEQPEKHAEEQVEDVAMKVEAEEAAVAAPQEKELDAPEDKRAKVDASSVTVSTTDSTINVMPVAGGKLLMTLSDGGAQNLLAGTRCTAGVRKGRYMFEVSIVELAQNSWENRGGNRISQLRVGLTTSGSSVLTDSDGQVSFDEEGTLYFGTKRKHRVGQRWGKGHTAAVVLNLDASSPNTNTVSLFIDGVRASEPQALPEDVVGKTLFPTVTYRGMSVRVNFGPTPVKPLTAFKCRMVADAAKDDVEVVLVKAQKPEVLFPIGLPGRGYFDFVDVLKHSRPGFTELSDRSSTEWATRSGWRPQGQTSDYGSLDRPSGVPELESGALRSVLVAVAPTLARDYIVPELRANLVASERQAAVAQFPKSEFKRTAIVALGEPNAEFKAHIQSLLLAQKKIVAEREYKMKLQELERRRLLEERRKKNEALLEERRKKAEAARKARDAKAAKVAATDEAAGGDEEQKNETSKEQEAEKPKGEKPLGEAAEGEKADAKMPDAAAEEKAEELKESVVELTEQEKQEKFRESETPDLTDWVLSKWFSHFSLPTAAEGFDEIVYAWDKEQAATKLLRDWVLDKKLTQRAEDLQPGQWFKNQHAAYTKALVEYRKIQGEFAKDPARKKKKAAAEEADEGEKNEVEINFDDLDVFAVQDISNIGDGSPLFKDFVYEDWALLSTFFELHYLLHAFKRDLNDNDRPSFKEKDLAYYFNKYFYKDFDVKTFGVEEFAEFLELVMKVMVVDETTGFFKAVLPDDTTVETMVKHVEEDRRERQRRIDAGDETAKLKFLRPTMRRPQQSLGQARQPGYVGQGVHGGTAHAGHGGGAVGPSAAPRRAAYGGGEKRPGAQYLVPASKVPRTSYAVGSSYPTARR